MILVQKSFTRITLALDIIRKIEDGKFTGYHELGIVKHQINLFDTITIEDSPRMSLDCDKPQVPCDESNICWKSVDIVKKKYSIDKNVAIHIQKNIPVMGGLAGGSANAATTLAMLNVLWNLQLDVGELMTLARLLGMDVPFYFTGRTAFDTEATEILDPIVTNCNFWFILAIPEFGVSTKDAYQGIHYSQIGKSVNKTAQLITALKKNETEQSTAFFHNDFEYSVFNKFQRLGQIKKQLLKAGAEAAMLSGSGSTILGIAFSEKDANVIASKIDCNSIISSTMTNILPL
jgi:4-diphosphocytidyl-2-C-methyl-D-erythritol kinase